MTYKIKQGTAIQFAVMLLTLGGMGQALADTPLSLALSETMTYDSNVLRSNSVKRRDLLSTTALAVGIDKSYGRQNYYATVSGTMSRYKNLKDFDYDGYDLKAGMSTEIGRDGSLRLQHNSGQSMQDFGSQGLSRTKELIKTSSTVLSGQYGLYGRWALTGSANRYEVEYDRARTENTTATGLRVGVRYSPTDLLYFDLGVKRTESELPLYPLFVDLFTQDPTAIGNRIKRVDLDLQTGWTVTGYSQLTGQLNWTSEKNDTMTDGVANDVGRDFKGLTGRFSWRFTPPGKMIYSLAFDRDTNNSGGNTYVFDLGTASGIGAIGEFGVGREAQKRISTGMAMSATWKATGKISASTSLTYRRINEARTNVASEISRSSTGDYRALSLSLNYDFSRALSFACTLSTYDRTQSLFSDGYSGESAACSATFSID